MSENDETLLEAVLVAMLSSDRALAAIPPRPALTDDDDTEKEATSLTVIAELTGREIGIVGDYAVTLKLARTFRQGEGDFAGLWQKILAIIKTPPAGLAIYTQLAHLTFDDIDFAAAANIEGNHLFRELKFRVWMAAS